MAVNQPVDYAWFGAGGEVISPNPASGATGDTVHGAYVG